MVREVSHDKDGKASAVVLRSERAQESKLNITSLENRKEETVLVHIETGRGRKMPFRVPKSALCTVMHSFGVSTLHTDTLYWHTAPCC